MQDLDGDHNAWKLKFIFAKIWEETATEIGEPGDDNWKREESIEYCEKFLKYLKAHKTTYAYARASQLDSDAARCVSRRSPDAIAKRKSTMQA